MQLLEVAALTFSTCFLAILGLNVLQLQRKTAPVIMILIGQQSMPSVVSLFRTCSLQFNFLVFLFAHYSIYLEKPMMNPMHESSMVLDFKSPRYSISKGPSMQSIPDDPYSEISNGEIVPISPVGSKTVRSMMNYKQRSFSTAFLEAKPSLLKNGDLVRRSSVGLLTERSFVKSRPPYQRTEIVKSRPASQRNEIPQTPVNERSIRAPSRRPSRVSVRSSEPVVEKAQSVAPSIKSNRTYRSTRTGPAKTADKPKSGRRQNRVHGVVSTKLGRSTTSTQLGSVTQRKTSPKKDRMKRSKTIVDPTLPTIGKTMISVKKNITRARLFKTNDVIS